MQQTTNVVRKCRKAWKFQSRLRCSIRSAQETCLGSCLIYFNDLEMVTSHEKKDFLKFNQESPIIFIVSKYLELQELQIHTCTGI